MKSINYKRQSRIVNGYDDNNIVIMMNDVLLYKKKLEFDSLHNIVTTYKVR